MANVPYPKYPVHTETHALILFLASFSLPGVATIVSGVLARRSMLARGILQLVLSPILVGVIWSIVSGYRTMRNAQAQ